MTRGRPAATMDRPEPNVVLMAFLVHYPWEFLQVPFFADMTMAPHWEAVRLCTRAALGDVVITLIAFWGTALRLRSRDWICRPRATATATFVGIGVGLTIVSERVATGPLDRWAYSDLMPMVPVLNVGLVPILQWVVLPPAIVWLVRRQLAGATRVRELNRRRNSP